MATYHGHLSWQRVLERDPVTTLGQKKKALNLSDLGTRVEKMDQLALEGTLVPSKCQVCFVGNSCSKCDSNGEKRQLIHIFDIFAPKYMCLPSSFLKKSNGNSVAMLYRTKTVALIFVVPKIESVSLIPLLMASVLRSMSVLASPSRKQIVSSSHIPLTPFAAYRANPENSSTKSTFPISLQNPKPRGDGHSLRSLWFDIPFYNSWPAGRPRCHGKLMRRG